MERTYLVRCGGVRAEWNRYSILNLSASRYQAQHAVKYQAQLLRVERYRALRPDATINAVNYCPIDVVLGVFDRRTIVLP